MKKRKPYNGKSKKRQFSKTADRTHKFNVKSRPMRGGIRM